MLLSQGVTALLMLGFLLFQPVQGSCPSQCLCAVDILSCSFRGMEKIPTQLPPMAATLDFNHNRLLQLEEGSFAGLPHLDTLRLAHNRLNRLAPGTFRNTSSLQHLDLSSNQLHVVEQHYFQELVGIKELLLFNNRITRVESRALASLSNLRKAYLSHNRLTDFPFFSIQENSHPFLRTLDLSSNRLPRLPLEDIRTLPMTVQRSLFLHNNTLICECSMYVLFRHWEQQNFASVRDYRMEHSCLVYGELPASVRFFQHSRFFENCTLLVQHGVLGEPVNNVQVNVGEPAILECQTSLQGQQLTFSWVSPNKEYIAPPGNNGSMRMHVNGTLELVAAQVEDSGVYWCMVSDQKHLHNETREVNVTIVPRRVEPEQFNTGFTTLLGCIVSLVLVFMYLYLTPCRCLCQKQQPVPTIPSPANECSAQSSILMPTPTTTTEGSGRKMLPPKFISNHSQVLDIWTTSSTGQPLRSGRNP
ncbi:amphoterin-induced protein 3-like isoform X2 [Denticeps clupeoides]|uniref:Ig-like domain-containing protein n=1 Tax=Denticeps clupeoides TaxID=299321 RepID=A0AAY4AXN3_9TELE|nr:amphoterin-induced protein 3-like isoform X2 [Denticeps clupeoides]XP_028853482.1 amphoterin-induced protein 3-like isoform X2 [Denticeps clupeoides]